MKYFVLVMALLVSTQANSLDKLAVFAMCTELAFSLNYERYNKSFENKVHEFPAPQSERDFKAGWGAGFVHGMQLRHTKKELETVFVKRCLNKGI